MSDQKINVSVESLQPSQYECWASKQGGSWKSWKRRYMVLKDRKLWYFVDKNSKSAKGWMDIPDDTKVENESSGDKYAFGMFCRGVKGERVLHIVVENKEDLEGLIHAIESVIKKETFIERKKN